jgi:hypothetical protein
MAAISVRNSMNIGYSHTRHTGLIFRTFDTAGLLIDSHDQVLIADLSTQVLGHAAPAAANGALTQPYAVNDREDNTGT